MAHILFSGPDAIWPHWEGPLRAALPGHELTREAAPGTVDVILYNPKGGLRDFSRFTRCRLVQSLWAGVETIIDNPTLTQPLARMVDPGLAEGMVEYVTGHVLRAHLGIDACLAAQNGVWRNDLLPPLARNRKVAVLGLGELGRACAGALAALNFRVTGWSRRPASIAGITTTHGPDGLTRALTGAEIVVLLLPMTPQTRNTLNTQTLGLLAPAATVINAGRGPLIDDDALLAALDSGQVAQATLDTFRTEPLPADHPFWAHPKVTVTPHIASETRAETASLVVAENVARVFSGAPPRFLVDRAAGY